jgi:ubiquitin-protein ligase
VAVTSLTISKHASLPDSSALAVACRDIDVRNVKALIIGPHETPYEFGFFEVIINQAAWFRLWTFANGIKVRVQV